MTKLSLNDSRWASLQHRLGSAGDVPARLQHLLECPDDRGAFSGLVRTYSSRDIPVPDFLAAAYEDTRGRALVLLGPEIAFEHDPANTRYLLAAAAALKGYPKIAHAIEWLDLIVEGSMHTDIEE
jgi:hypothetical protein